MIALSQHLIIKLLKLLHRLLASINEAAHRFKLLKVLLAALAGDRLQVRDLDSLLLHHVFQITDLIAQVLVFLLNYSFFLINARLVRLQELDGIR